MAEHAILSASGAYRWSVCTPSARFEQQFDDSSSLFALEGTIAHAVGEWALKGDGDALAATPELVPELLRLEEVHGEDWQKEVKGMLEHVQGYVEYCLALPGEHFTENKVDFSHIVPEGFGTSDFIALQDTHADIVDLKYGKGLMVFADGPQAKLYAVGAIHDYDYLFENIETISLHIYQPRLDHVDVHDMTIEELEAFAEEIKPKAALAWKGEGEFVPGSHCGFCRGKAVCKARANHNIKIAMEDFAVPTPPPNTLTAEEIASLLPQMEQIGKWITEVQEYALAQLLAGKEIPGYKVVEGRSNRKWLDENQVVSAMRASGLSDEQIYNMKVISITEAEKLLGKKSEVFDLTEKPEGKPTLAPEADKRKPMRQASAARDFT